MTEGHATEPEQGSAGKTLKRRGILAVAAAAMAGIAAKQLAEPVGATAGGTNGTALIIGANSTMGNTPNTYTATTTLRPTSGSSVPTNTPPGVALYGVGQDGYAGLYGASDGHASVFGFRNKQGGIAVRGSIDPAVRVAPYTFAGVFDGTVVVSGSLFIGGTRARTSSTRTGATGRSTASSRPSRGSRTSARGR